MKPLTEPFVRQAQFLSAGQPNRANLIRHACKRAQFINVYGLIDLRASGTHVHSCTYTVVIYTMALYIASKFYFVSNLVSVTTTTQKRIAPSV